MIRKKLRLGAIGALSASVLFGAIANYGQAVVTQDKLHSYAGVLQEAAVLAPATGKPHAKTNDFVADFTPAGGSIWITNATFLNAATANDVLTFAFWAKKYDILDESSAFWADSSQRGF